MPGWERLTMGVLLNEGVPWRKIWAAFRDLADGAGVAQWAVGSRIVSKIVKMPPSPVSTHAK